MKSVTKIPVEQEKEKVDREAGKEADVNAGNATRQIAAEKHSIIVATRVIEGVLHKRYWDAWTLADITDLMRRSLSHPLCPTCKGSGYQNLIGFPSCQGGCEDCGGTGLALMGRREARSVVQRTEEHLTDQVPQNPVGASVELTPAPSPKEGEEDLEERGPAITATSRTQKSL